MSFKPQTINQVSISKSERDMSFKYASTLCYHLNTLNLQLFFLFVGYLDLEFCEITLKIEIRIIF